MNDELGGHWGDETATFLKHLAHTEARQASGFLRHTLADNLIQSWRTMRIHAATHAFTKLIRLPQHSGHRPLYRKHLEKYDVQFRKLVRCIVGPPPGTDWSAQWHDILHGWKIRVDHWSHASGIFSCVSKEMHDSILEFRFLHCKFTCRTLGEEDTCMD